MVIEMDQNIQKPSIRFKGFTDTWEQCNWKEKVDILTNMVNPINGEYNNLPHIGPGNIESFTGKLLNNVKTVGEDGLISGKFQFEKDDIIYGKINPQLGKYVYAPYKGLCSADSYVLRGKNDLKQTFLYTLLQTDKFYKYSVSVSMRSGMPKINRSELSAFDFIAPTKTEQDKIGTFILSIEKLITLHQRKVKMINSVLKAIS
jgi:restriction endonuclease S subunit